RQVPIGDGNRDIGDVTDLSGQVTGHHVDAFGQILPNAAHVAHLGLAAELAFGADLTGDARHFGRKGVELIDHGIDRFFQLEDLAFDVDGDFLRQVAVGDSDRHFRDVTNLSGQVAGHDVDAFGQILPNAAHVAHLGLTAELAFGADLTGDASHFGGKAAQLIDHGIDRFFELKDFTADIDGDFLRQVTVGNCDGDIGDAPDLSGQVAGHQVDAIGQVLPGAGDTGDDGLTAKLAFGADFTGDAGDFSGKTAQLIHHGIDGVLQLENFAFDIDGDLLR